MREEWVKAVCWVQGGDVLLTCVSAGALVKRRAQNSMQGGADASFHDGHWSDRRQQSQDWGGQYECVHHLPWRRTRANPVGVRLPW